jgi:eukaryotic-like serine/threonine-protein kinase
MRRRHAGDRLSCLDEDSVVAFVDGNLSEEEHASIEGHLAVCPPCADLVTARTGQAPKKLAPRSLRDTLSNEGELAPGATVGRYTILALIGRGGMGEVYAAYDPRLDRKIALKLLNETMGQEAQAQAAQERLLREAQSIARLSHPNVVVVHDAGAIDDDACGGRVYLAMEFIEGQTLADWLAAEPRSWRAVCEVFAAAGEGLLAAHQAALVHRDFKPQNVMVGRDGTVRVTDFGLASDASDVAASDTTMPDLASSATQPTTDTIALTATGVLLGTPLYMAPEQLQGRPTDARTDQFRFCVALYEALFGERPFPSDSLQTLVSAVVAGRVRQPSQKARVPSFVRKVVLRGLQSVPTSRYPSMRELIASLRADPLRRRRTGGLGAALAVAIGLAVAGAGRVATRGQRMCHGAADKLAGVWELDDRGQRRTAVHDALLATGRSFAGETWIRVSALLDDYHRRWTDAYTDTCEATHVRGDQSAEVLDLRMACLDGSRSGFRALTDLLSHADGAAVVGAVDAAHALPRIERCSDVTALRAVVPLPADAATRARVVELGKRLAEAKALSETGTWTEARRQIVPLVQDARTAGYEPLLAEALDARAWLEGQLGNPAASAKTQEEALWVALATHRDDIAAESAAELLAITAYFVSRPEEQPRWEPLAEALLERLGPGHDRIAAWFHQALGLTSFRQGDYRRALIEYDLGRVIKEKVLPPNHPDIAISLCAISSAQLKMGEGAKALVAAQEALTIERTAYGSGSPLQADALEDRGEAFGFLHRYKEAEEDLRSSVDFVVAVVGADHLWTAYPLNALGKTLLAEGKYREALPVLEKAHRIRQGADPRADNIAETRFALARARWALNRDRPGALALAIAARDAYRKLPGEAKRFEEIEAWLADK